VLLNSVWRAIARQPGPWQGTTANRAPSLLYNYTANGICTTSVVSCLHLTYVLPDGALHHAIMMMIMA
jgi:hypothetical protein